MAQPETIGKYEVLEKVAQLGEAAVYRCYDPIFERPVTVKLCTAGEESFRRRFLRAAERAADLRHSLIVPVVESGVDEDGAPFQVQEYEPGNDLEHLIRERAELDLATRVDLLLQIAEGMAHAHAQGFVHRDLRPSNVHLLDGEFGQILDFGVARLVNAHTRLADGDGAIEFAGALAPEQILGRPIDPRADLFAFGVTAYRLLTYTHPFAADDLTDLYRKVLREEPEPLGSVLPDCPPELETVVERCLRKDPDQRYARFDEIVPELEAALAAVDPERVRPTRQPPPAVEERASGESAEEAESPPVVLPPLGRSTRPPFSVRLREGLGDLLAGGRGRRAALAAGLVAAAGLAAAVWWSVESRSSEPAPAPEPAPAVAPELATPAELPGALVLEALPWGEVVRILDVDGAELPLPATRHTPLIVPVPPGRYRVSLSGPGAEEPLLCQVEVPSEARGRCLVEFAKLDTIQYFKEVGWWR